MTNINLYQSSTEGGRGRKKLSLVDSGFFWSLGLFLLVALFFGGLKLVSTNLQAKKQVLSESIAQETASIAGGDLDRVVDFQARMDESVDNISSKRNTDAIFSAVESSMVNGVKINSFSYENTVDSKPRISMEMTGGDFPVIARQILSFKENPVFTNVSMQEIVREEESIIFKIIASLK